MTRMQPRGQRQKADTLKVRVRDMDNSSNINSSRQVDTLGMDRGVGTMVVVGLAGRRIIIGVEKR